MKRIFMISGITVLCAGIAAAFIYLRAPADAPLPSAMPAPKQAIDLAGLKAKAEKGDTQSQMALAKALAQGEGVPRDYKQAAHWCGLAASNGNIEAEAMMGELCQAGRGLSHDLTNAMRWLNKAAKDGSVAAQYDLGFMYERGQGVAKDEKVAAHWYQLASEGGDALGQLDYGQRCIAGLGVAKDPVEGLKWLLLAGAQGQVDAQAKAESLQKSLSGEQISEAKKRAAAFAPRALSR
jgi:TPR repeat protein